MKKVTAFIGSAQKRATYRAVLEFEKNLKRLGDVDFEVVFLSERNLQFCRGCVQCFNKGEALCPLKDDRDMLMEKLERSDGVVFATPSYAFQVSACMKNFLDRTAFLFHRPRYFGKAFTAVVTMGMPVGGKIRKYLESSGANMGFHVVKGSCLWTLAPMTAAREEKLKREMERLAGRFHRALRREAPPTPSLLQLLQFRFSRTGIRVSAVKYHDYDHFRDAGWFASDYYYETNLGPFKKLAGLFFDWCAALLFRPSGADTNAKH